MGKPRTPRDLTELLRCHMFGRGKILGVEPPGEHKVRSFVDGLQSVGWKRKKGRQKKLSFLGR